MTAVNLATVKEVHWVTPLRNSWMAQVKAHCCEGKPHVTRLEFATKGEAENCTGYQFKLKFSL